MLWVRLMNLSELHRLFPRLWIPHPITSPFFSVLGIPWTGSSRTDELRNRNRTRGSILGCEVRVL